MEAVTHEENVRRITDSENIPYWKDLEYEINEQTGCWIAKSNQRRKYVWVRAQGKLVWAHRLFFCRAKHKMLQPNEELDHLCNTPRCLNPDHMEIVDHQENMRRATARRNETAARCA
jgi:hypothetical protein